ncbi:hypothetical protein ScPMuIL_009736 [Solemya velum]
MGTDTKLVEATKVVWRRVMRKKQMPPHDETTQFRRCLSTTRLTMIGLGSTVGVGIYVLIGVATKEYAGPAVLLSFLIAGLTTLLNALCFAEFAGKTPITGAFYTFAYQHIGEAVAFLVGWSQLLMYYTSNATTARAWSGYLDSLFDSAVKNYTIQTFGRWEMGPPFGEFPDFLAVAVIAIVVIITSVGINFSSLFNAVFAGISVSILLFATFVGFAYADTNNWKNPDHGGFMPFGISGVFAGASACFYAYSGYDMISMSAEEAKSPEKSIPRAIVIELIIVMVLYLITACSFTLMVPYWQIDTRAPFPSAFALNGITWAKYIVAIGPVLALTNLSLLGMYGTSRQTYIMSKDGLLFQSFSYVNKRTKTPLFSTIVTGVIVTILAIILDLKDLVGFMVILGFINFTVLCSYVIINRYKISNDHSNSKLPIHKINSEGLANSESLLQDLDAGGEELVSLCEDMSEVSLGRQNSSDNGTQKSEIRKNLKFNLPGVGVKFLLLIIVCCTLLFSVLLLYCSEDVLAAKADTVFSISVLLLLIATSTFTISRRTQIDPKEGQFKVPFMPLLPVCAMMFNIFLLVAVVDCSSGIVCAILVLIGALIYVILILKETWGTFRKKKHIASALSQEEDVLLENEGSNDEL